MSNRLVSARSGRMAAVLMNLLLPGLGHIYWREYSFGIFVFTIMLLAVILVGVGFLFSLAPLALVVLLGLPALFYLFSFVDLARSIRKQGATGGRSRRATTIYLAVSLLFQMLAPIAPLNFGWRNRPELFRQSDSSLSPAYHQGELLKVSRLAYKVDIAFFSRPVFHSLPERFDLVRYVDDAGRRHAGYVFGRPEETVELLDGLLLVNGVPVVDEPPGLTLQGDYALTRAGSYSVLVGTVSLGYIDAIEDVPLTNLVGRVDRLL